MVFTDVILDFCFILANFRLCPETSHRWNSYCFVVYVDRHGTDICSEYICVPNRTSICAFLLDWIFDTAIWVWVINEDTFYGLYCGRHYFVHRV